MTATPNTEDIRASVAALRETPVEGVFVDLVPLGPEHLEKVVSLRNVPQNRHFLNQGRELTVEDQRRWLDSYLGRGDDVYWAICDKQGEMLGTLRLYDIDDREASCVQGSFIVDEARAKEAPYAAEAELLSLDVAFGVLRMRTVVNEDRVDNKVMNSLTRRMGFSLVGITTIRGIEYNSYVLKKDNFEESRDRLENLIRQWEARMKKS